MKVYINHDEHTFEKALTLEELIIFLKVDARGMAIAINNQVIPRSLWSKQFIQDQNKLTLIRATQGG